jgi:phosphoenolpyruvate carboxylase
LVDLDIAGAYAGLVSDQALRQTIFAMIKTELELTKKMVLKVSGGKMLAERFPQHRAALATRLPTINEVNREQVDLLRLFRSADEADKERYKPALLLSINCVAAGLGATG